MAASDAARLMLVVVLPTPPFWFAIAIILVNELAPGNSVTVGARFLQRNLYQMSMLAKPGHDERMNRYFRTSRPTASSSCAG